MHPSETIDEESRFYAMHFGCDAYITEVDGDDDETGTINSFSTTATTDDNPGTGRILDTYFFQPVGRRIERLAMRFTIQHLHPWRIEVFINRSFGYFPKTTIKSTLNYALQEINGVENGLGPTVIAGLKSLVRQAQ